jgi:hypothetical protein
VRAVVPIRLGDREREQIAKAAGLQNMPVSTYLRCAALQASAVAIGKATVASRPPRRERKVPERKLLVVDPEPPKRPHYVNGELARR